MHSLWYKQTVVPIVLRVRAQMNELVEDSSDYLSWHSDT